MEKIFVTFWIVFGIYMLVMIAILADLWSGIRKAKQMNVARTSYGYRRTITKIAQYYNVLIALTVVDAMQMSAVWYAEQYYEYKIILFPFVTLIGGVAFCLIEIKSIYEKAEDKVRLDNAGQLVGKIITNRDDISEIVKSVVDYMNQKQENDGTKEKQTHD
ncbi:hypothetical protein CAPN008_11780 [Capnocytophaga canis]|uniref:hypothetical protein n=1 Tax=Capnocytophaga canis TaxID=1848903 RepID=UPI001AC90382|nr:hypothetical protein [Capnocytophaga canis]GIM61128.1 hypothetical protein CAPN008_11780 [Capnocytophaga canis]